MAHTYNIGTGAWVQDPQEGWVASKVISKSVDGTTAALVFEITSGDRAGEVGYIFSNTFKQWCKHGMES